MLGKRNRKTLHAEHDYFLYFSKHYTVNKNDTIEASNRIFIERYIYGFR